MDDHDKTLDSADGEDIPSDFFDDFSKEEFVKGLSIVDSWEDCDKGKNPKRRFDSEEPGIDIENRHSTKDSRREVRYLREGHGSSYRRSGSNTKLDDYIKPGSRRDPNKTNEAIRRDKEVKVKEHLAKHLESTDDIRPPGTELDDFFNVQKVVKKMKSPLHEESHKKSVRSRSREYRERDRRTPPKKSNYKHEEHQKNSYRSSYRSLRQSPRPFRSRRPSPNRRSYRRYSPHNTMRRYSPRKSRHSRSPDRGHTLKSRRSPSPGYKDSFLYPNVSKSPAYTPKNSYEIDSGPSYISAPTSSYIGAPLNEFSIPGSSYIQGQVYAGNFGGYNGYTGQPVQSAITEPQPVPTTVMDQASGPMMSVAHPPSMVPAPIVVPSANTTMQQYQMDRQSPYDALAQLVADGKLSQEDYLKLAPNKGGGTMLMDDKARIMVLSRCDEAISKLSTLILPNHLLINNNLLAPELKSITPKYCSPLKRHQPVEFHFTKAQNSLTLRQNRQLLDSIIACIGFEQVAPKLKKKNKDMKDAAVQTMKPYCDVCEIRVSTNFNEAGTSIDPDYFCSTVHTQVLEQDLINSKSIFNPSGSVGVSEPISIAHLTPAQLVSQLAARAKTLKQTETRQPSNQFGRRNQPNNFDGRGDGQQYHYDNYRY